MKMCSKCGMPYKGWGDVCGGCRDLKSAGTAKACSICGIFFIGLAENCDECRKVEDIESGDGGAKGEDSLVQQADALEKVAKVLCPLNIEEEVAKEHVFQVNSHSEKVDDVAGARLVEPTKPELVENGAPATNDTELAGHGASATITDVSRKHQLKHITLQKLNGKRIEVTFPEEFELSGSGQHAAPSTMSVAALKSDIRDHLAIPRNKQISLVLDDALLQDERTLVDSGVVDGSVLNLVVAKRAWLEALQEEANSWTWDGQRNSSADLVSDDMHQKLLAGERCGYSPSTVQHLLSQIKWLSNVLDKEDVEKIGKVWHTRSDQKIASPNFRTNRKHTQKFVFELSSHAYQVSWFTTDFSFSIPAHCDDDDDWR